MNEAELIPNEAAKELEHKLPESWVVPSTLVARAFGIENRHLINNWRDRGLPTVQVGRTLFLESAQVVEHFPPSRAAAFVPTRVNQCGVYFLRSQGFVKIGYATDLVRRMEALQIANPIDLELVLFLQTRTLSDAVTLERALHRRFAQHRHRGEWFRDCPEIGAFAAAELHK